MTARIDLLLSSQEERIESKVTCTSFSPYPAGSGAVLTPQTSPPTRQRQLQNEGSRDAATCPSNLHLHLLLPPCSPGPAVENQAPSAGPLLRSLQLLVNAEESQLSLSGVFFRFTHVEAHKPTPSEQYDGD